MFQEKKVGIHKHNFSLAMHGWGVFLNNKRYSMQKKRNVWKIDLFLSFQNFKIDLFYKFLRKYIKYVVSRVVSDALEVALLRAINYSKRIPR